MPDKELLAGLKKAKGTEMFFVFIPKGTDGQLIISKARIPPKEITDAKSEIRGEAPVVGKCYGDGRTMVFETVKPVPAKLIPVIRKVAKRETGLTIEPEFRQPEK